MTSPDASSPASPPPASGEPMPAAWAVEVAANDHERNAVHKFPDNFIKTSKYNILTFIPFNLFHQFRKISNFYFLINAIVAVIPDVSPLSPATAIMPLIFVLAVAAIKDGYEDYLRHVADNKANSTLCHVVRKKEDGKMELAEIESKDVQVGDIIRMDMGKEFRADLILLSSSLTEAQCFIETCNLDGETNLKNRKGIEETWELKSPEAIDAAKIEIKTHAPDPGLLHWEGVMVVNKKSVSVGLNQFLYRAAVLKNTEWIYAVVVYAGVDTKMFRNLQEKPPKMSALDVKLNYLILVVLIAQILFLFAMATGSVIWNNSHASHWYLRYYLNRRSGFTLWGYRVLSYFILMSYMIPISLFVTIELCKVAQAKLMQWDHGLMEWMNDKWATCTPNTSNLNEQLSQVKFIFSDKTGTLTENIMNYLNGDINGLPVDAHDWEISRGYLKNPTTKEQANKYFKALAICHTIQPFPDLDHPGKLKYDGASPDEVALVRCAIEHGFVLTERSTKTMTLVIDGVQQVFEIMETLEFTPERKMMSIVVREPDGTISMFTKGADSFVIPRLQDGLPNSEILPPMKTSLKELAILGLRTLIVCGRTLTQEQYDEWHPMFVEAGQASSNRAKKVDEMCLELEKQMVLVGATAIEDKLQDQVPETLKFFLAAGVVVWMLTGDKRETAVTIAATSSLADPQKDYIDHVDIGELKLDSQEASDLVLQQLNTVASHIKANDKLVTFVIDGPALHVAMHKHFDLFLENSQHVSSAVCCRLTPLQKANVVGMFQKATGATALAVGDGANDVSMIQEGQVGVGIVGLEGAQAALAADYAIPRFKHLRRLCAVHGRYSVVRNALTIVFSFYKNILLSMTQFYFSFYAGFSGMTLYDGWLLSFYNFAFTSLPPLFVGMFEKDLTEQPLMEKPNLFPPLSDGLYFDVPTLVQWFVESILHSLILFYVGMPTLLRLDILDYKLMDSKMCGTIIITAMVFLVLTKLALHIRYWIYPEVIALAVSYIFYIIFTLSYSAIPDLFGDSSFYYTAYHLMADAKTWLYMIFFVMGLLIPIDYSIMYLQRAVKPTLRDELQDEYDK